MCFLWIPVVIISQGVDRLHSVGLRCSWTFTVLVFNDHRGSPYLFLFTVLSTFCIRHSFSVTILPLGFRLVLFQLQLKRKYGTPKER